MTKLKNPGRRLNPYLSTLGLLCACTACPAAPIVDATAPSGTPLQIVCAPDRPLVGPGESVTVRAWVTDASGKPVEQTIRLKWSAGIGEIAGENVATWSFKRVAENSSGVISATAQVTGRDATLGQDICKLQVYIAPTLRSPSSAPPLRSPSSPSPERLSRPSTRSFLLPGNETPKGYGLYSYLLFNTPPNGDQERERYLKAIEAYLRILQPMEEMEMHLLRSELNIVLLPVKRSIDLPDNLSDPNQAARTAQQVLEVFDYARAKVLLSHLTGNIFKNGPYLVSIIPPDIHNTSAPLFFDMSHVVPKLVSDWVSTFCSLAAQERSWSDIKLTKLALNTRNVIAVGAREMPDVARGLEQWIQILNPR